MITAFRNTRQRKKLVNHIVNPETKVISFDLFDTLLSQEGYTYGDIWGMVAQSCNLNWDFAHIRISAERAAREALPPDQEEVTLNEIYSQVQRLAMLPDAEAERIKQAELAVLLQSFQVNPDILPLYRKGMDTGKKVVFCSDTYLPETFVQQLLERVNISGYHSLYLSGSFRTRKANGGLYRIVKDDLGKDTITASQILHIGSSYETDFLQAQNAGIRGYYLPARRQTAAWPPHLGIKQSVKHAAWKTGLFPVVSKVYHRLQRMGAGESGMGSQAAWEQIRELLQTSLDELERFAGTLPAEKENILFLGHIAGFDKGVCGYLNRVSEQMPGYSWLLLSETPQMAREEIAEKIRFPFLVIPRDPFSGVLDFGVVPARQDDDSVCVTQNPRLAEAVENICGRFPGAERRYVEWLVRFFYRYCTRALQLLHPRLVILWNQFMPFHRVMEAVCLEQNVPCSFMEFGSIAGTLALDSKGQMGESAAAIDPSSVLNISVSAEERALTEQICGHLSAVRLNRNPQPRNEDRLEEIRHFCEGNRVVVFFGQNDYAAGLYPYTENSRQFHSPAYKSSLQAVRKTADVCRQHGWKLIYKPHPAMEMESERAQTPKDVLTIDNVSIYELFSVADVVVTIASQCAYEALLHNAPVVMLGYNQLRGKHCTYEAFERDSLDSVLCQAMSLGFTEFQRKAFRNHVAQMIKSCLYDDESQRPVRYGRNREAFISELLERMNEYETYERY